MLFSPPVAAVLEHEAIAGLSGSKPSGLRGRSSSRVDDSPEHSLDTMMKSVSTEIQNIGFFFYASPHSFLVGVLLKCRCVYHNYPMFLDTFCFRKPPIFHRNNYFLSFENMG